MLLPAGALYTAVLCLIGMRTRSAGDTDDMPTEETDTCLEDENSM